MRIKNGFLIGRHVSVIVATDMLLCIMGKPESKCVSITKFAHFTLFHISHKSPQVSVKAFFQNVHEYKEMETRRKPCA